MSEHTAASGLLDVKHAADYLGMNEETLRRLAKAKKIKHSKIGPRGWLYRFKLEWLDQYVEGAIVEVETAKPQPTPSRSTTPRVKRSRTVVTSKTESFRERAKRELRG